MKMNWNLIQRFNGMLNLLEDDERSPSPARRGSLAKLGPLDSFSLRGKVAAGRMRVKTTGCFLGEERSWITGLITSLTLAIGLCACSGTTETLKDEKPEKEESTSAGNPLTAPLDYVGAVGKAKKSSEKRLNLANLQNAIKQFQAVEGRYPKTLNELVTEGYFSRAPRPPRGMRYVYNPKTGQVGVR